MNFSEILQRLHATQKSDYWVAKCPAHDDNRESLSIKEDNGKILLKCHAGCSYQDIKDALGIKAKAKAKTEIVATYNYFDANSPDPRYQIVRKSDKSFWFRRQEFGKWVWKVGTTRIIPYNLNLFKENPYIFICEGEKDCDNMLKAGLLASTNPFGAGKWRKSLNPWFAGKIVTILPDKDAPGRKHAQDVAQALSDVAEAIYVIELPGKGKDATDWLKAGGTPEDLKKLLSQAEKWEPPSREENIDSGCYNYLDLGKRKEPLATDIVVTKILDRLDGTLARIGASTIFRKPELPGGELHYIEDTPGFFAHLGYSRKESIDWGKGPGLVSKTEAFRGVVPRLQCFKGVENAPHHPPMQDIWYNHPALPEPNLDLFNRFIMFFEPVDCMDQFLIASMFLTACWGGPCGQRPLFVITSPDGKATGKSTLATFVPYLLGQMAIRTNTKMKIEEKVIPRLLSPEGLKSRTIIFDNEIDNVKSEELAGLITSPIISGHQMYKGEGQRPNNMLWIMTLNTPSLDGDLASRSVPVRVKKPEFSGDWEIRVRNFVDTHRWNLISTIIHLLKKDFPKVSVSTRFGPWEKEVLSKCQEWCKDITEIQRHLTELKTEFDADIDVCFLLKSKFEEYMENTRKSTTYCPDWQEEKLSFFFSNEIVAEIYQVATGSHLKYQTCLRKVRELIKGTELKALTPRTVENKRGLIWLNDSSSEMYTVDVLSLKQESNERSF